MKPLLIFDRRLLPLAVLGSLGAAVIVASVGLGTEWPWDIAAWTREDSPSDSRCDKRPTLDLGAATSSLLRPPTDHVKRTNILLLGVDRRDDEPMEQARSDAIIVVSIDEPSRSVVMISLPRDLWVSIPGHGEQRLNVAHALGGPSLTMRTIEVNFGIPLHHYARIDFRGFERMVDLLGGVELDVPRAINDDEYPTEDYGVMGVHIPEGRHTMDGRTALQYARSRHGDDDFGRARRQQQVLVAMRDRAIRADLLLKSTELLPLARKLVGTDLGVADQFRLARVATSVDRARIRTVVLDGPYVRPTLTSGGAQVLIPDLPAIRSLVEEELAAVPAAAPRLATVTRNDRALTVAEPVLLSHTFTPKVMSAGQMVELAYVISNPGCPPLAIVLGASIRPGAGHDWIDDPVNDVRATIPPGQVTLTRPFRIPPGSRPGAYDIAWSVLSEDMRHEFDATVKTGVLSVRGTLVGR